MTLHGQHLLAGTASADGSASHRATDPATGLALEPAFHEATSSDVDRALEAAEAAFQADRDRPAADRVALLERIATEIEDLGDTLVERVMAETGLPEGRVRGERGRTTGQLCLFAETVRDGSWVGARIDRAQPDREPAPKPDLRRMLIPLGPVVVFGASNFPLAFSVAGGDTASALAAGCPVVAKAHPAHPGTSELIGRAIAAAVEACGFHPGTFSLVHALEVETSQLLVTHPLTRAVGFTGSLRAGRALFDAAAARPDPIPVYAEMGSTNPVFLLPGALEDDAAAVAQGFVGSLTMGAGQFCTNPGVVVGLEDGGVDAFVREVTQQIEQTAASTMLTDGIRSGYDKGVEQLRAADGVEVVATGHAGDTATPAQPAVFVTSSRTFADNADLRDEVFGPAALVVRCADLEDMMQTARDLEGHLTATVWGTDADLEAHADLLRVLAHKVGRLLVNGFPTGVEVCPSMHHGGPYPATTDVRSTSVGTAAIERFARPVCYQNLPHAALPPELQDSNPRDLWRMVDGSLTKDAV